MLPEQTLICWIVLFAVVIYLFILLIHYVGNQNHNATRDKQVDESFWYMGTHNTQKV